MPEIPVNTGKGLDSDHLDYGCALTIHRAQGATYGRRQIEAAAEGAKRDWDQHGAPEER